MKTIERNIELTMEERDFLTKLVRGRKSSGKEILHANILLGSDIGRGSFLAPTKLAVALNTSKQTVIGIKKRYFSGGIVSAVFRKKRAHPPVPAKITGDVEAKVIALACSKAPEGRNRWTLRLLADKSVELKYIESISYKSVETLLKKHNLSLI